ncbi:MAG: hypothetical protein K9I85_08235 [Saprospiraceae bacterium]|nr:hypothetical protein [Saprospiraceae bacterium]
MDRVYLIAKAIILLLWIGPGSAHGQEMDRAGIPRHLEDVFNESPNRLHAILRNEESWWLDSIIVLDNLTGELTSKETFQYDQSGRPIQILSIYSEDYPIDQLLTLHYPENDTVLIATEHKQQGPSQTWTPTWRTFTVQKSPGSIGYISDQWLTNASGWIPVEMTDEVYNSAGQLEERIQSSFQIATGKWLPSSRVSKSYNSNGLIQESTSFSYWASTKNWLPTQQVAYTYFQDSILQEKYWKHWSGSEQKWYPYQWEHWDIFPDDRFSIRTTAQPEFFTDDWVWIDRRDYYQDSLGRDIAIVYYLDCWPDSIQTTDSLLFEYDEYGFMDQEMHFVWQDDHWERSTLHRYEHMQCKPYAGILDSVWDWDVQANQWNLGAYESCSSVQNDQLIIEIDSVSFIHPWKDVDMKVIYFYQDSTAHFGHPPDTETNTFCQLENPYEPASQITCFSSSAFQGQEMTVLLSNLQGQIMHVAHYPSGQSFALPAFTPPGTYVLYVQISSGPSFVQKLQIRP